MVENQEFHRLEIGKKLLVVLIFNFQNVFVLSGSIMRIKIVSVHSLHKFELAIFKLKFGINYFFYISNCGLL